MTTVYLYDDQRARDFEPFASVRPVSELVAGAWPIRHRWLTRLGESESAFVCGPRMRHFTETVASQCANGPLRAGNVVANARFAPAAASQAATSRRRRGSTSVWQADGRVAAVRLRDDIDVGRFDDGTISLEQLAAGTGDIEQLAGSWIDEIWDFIRLLPTQLADDLATYVATLQPLGDAHRPPASAVVLGDHPVVVLQMHGTMVEPHVVFDASNGPIVVGAGAHIRAFSRINGPTYIGEHTNIMGGDISGCSIGSWCKVRGEISTTIVLGHANKGHDGFVGHSYIGRWVNLGAGTITSNLKNTYGHVVLWTPHGLRDTGMQFLGTFFGDHVKTGIGLRLTTGTVLGTGANVFGSMPPKAVAPFSWGDGTPYGTFDLDRFLVTAERMMSRREVPLSDGMRQHLTGVHKARWAAPDQGKRT